MSDRIRRQHRYTITPEHLILDPRVSDRGFRLWCRLDRYAGEQESAYPTRETLAIELDCSPASIDRATRELVETGWLRKERRAAGDTCLYTLVTAPSKEVERLAKAARAERVEATEGRREKARANRKAAKKRANVKSSDEDENAEVNDEGVVTSDNTSESGGVVTHDETPLVTHDETGVVTGDEQKEAPQEGSISEGDSDSSLRSEPGASSGDSAALFDTPTATVAADNDLTPHEAETGRDAEGQPLKGKKLTDLAQMVTKAWWDWITDQGHEKPAQSFIACRGVVRAALGNGVAPKKIKVGLAKITKEGRAVSGASLTIAMQPEHVTATPRRNEIDWDAAGAQARQIDQTFGFGGAGA